MIAPFAEQFGTWMLIALALRWGLYTAWYYLKQL